MNERKVKSEACEARRKQADKTKIGDVWRNLKTGKTAKVTGRGIFFSIYLAHESGRKSIKFGGYLASEFELLEARE